MHPPILLIFTLFLTATADPLPLHSSGFTASLKRVWTLPRRSEGDILYRNRVEHGRRRLALATGQLKLEKQFTRIGIPSLKGNQVDIEDLDDEMKALLAVSEAEEEDGYHSTRLEIESMDIGYVCKTFIGTPLREFNMLVDSGSADFWVPREGCMSESGKKCAHTTLGSNSSSTFRSSNDFFFISYGSGDVLGSMANDTLSIADLQLKEYRFGTVVIESDYIAL
ncbi:hypothetical protein MPER_12577 [Moniliophthora perniciosa FA553]|nr:hypothetical protein MPER_12577 [Moniliophthora perniciosa FA553]